jgi:hypothetical protein
LYCTINIDLSQTYEKIAFHLLFHVFVSVSSCLNKMTASKSVVFVFVLVLLQVVFCDKYHAKYQAGKTQAFATEGKF